VQPLFFVVFLQPVFPAGQAHKKEKQK